jgi:hypothetical protein
VAYIEIHCSGCAAREVDWCISLVGQIPEGCRDRLSKPIFTVLV